jgi:hypothetical protein
MNPDDYWKKPAEIWKKAASENAGAVTFELPAMSNEGENPCPKMHPEIKAMWVAALRSGEYVQGYNALESDGEFCCLGVLCHIANKHGVINRVVEGSGDYITYNESWSLPPVEILSWAGLDETNPNVYAVNPETGNRMLVNLSTVNDTFALSFSEIADLIDEQL